MENSKNKFLVISVLGAVVIAMALMLSIFASATPTQSTSSSNDEKKLEITSFKEGNQDDAHFMITEKGEWVGNVNLDLTDAETYTYTQDKQTIEEKEVVVGTILSIQYKDSKNNQSIYIRPIILPNHGYDVNQLYLCSKNDQGQLVNLDFTTSATPIPEKTSFVALCGHSTSSQKLTVSPVKAQPDAGENAGKLFVNDTEVTSTVEVTPHNGAKITTNHQNHSSTIICYETAKGEDGIVTKAPVTYVYQYKATALRYEGDISVVDSSTTPATEPTEILNNAITVTANENHRKFTVDGIVYSVFDNTNLKKAIADKAAEAGTEPTAETLAVLNSMPRYIAGVVGLSGDVPEKLAIPSEVTIGELTWPVMCIAPKALTSNTVTSLELPWCMKIVMEDSATGLTKLNKVTSKSTGMIFLGSHETLVKEEATETNYDATIKYLAGNTLTDDEKTALGKISSFAKPMAASYKNNSGDIEAWSVNDNPNRKFESTLHPENIKYKTLAGTYEVANNDPTAKPFCNIMLAKGTITVKVVDKDTGNAINNATITAKDEFGKTHTATTNSAGNATINDLFQSAVFMDSVDTYKQYFKEARTVTAECSGYKKVELQDVLNGKDAELLHFKSYTYSSPSGHLSSNVIFEDDCVMERESYQVYLSSAINMNYVVDIAGGSKESGANAQLYQSNKTGAQKFNMYDVEPATNEGRVVTLINDNSGKALDLNGGQAQNGGNVQQYEPNGTDAQKWILTTDNEGYATLSSKVDSKYVIDVNAGIAANGQNVQVYENNGTYAQKFRLLSSNPSVPGGTFDLPDGNYYIKSTVEGSDTALDVQWASKLNCANVWAYKYQKGNKNQQWKVTNLGSGYFSVVNVNTGKALDVAGCNLIPGTNVWQYTYSRDNAAQQWSIFKDAKTGTYILINAGTGLALDLAGANPASETNVQGYFYNGSAAQKWAFVKAE